MMKSNTWKPIGTVLGETDIDQFYFSLKIIRPKKVIL